MNPGFDWAADAWLSQVLGKPAHAPGAPALAWPALEQGRAELASLGPGPLLAYAKLAATERAGVALLENLGFSLVETSLQLARPLLAGQPRRGPAIIRPARAEDEEPLAQLAATGFPWARFAQDPRLGPEVCGQVKQAWLGNFFRGRRGQALLVAELDRRPAGFVLLLKNGQTLTVDLIAVDERSRGKGLGRDLLAAAQDWGEQAGCREICAGTQLVNQASLALYQSAGFRLISGGHVYHLHR